MLLTLDPLALSDTLTDARRTGGARAVVDVLVTALTDRRVRSDADIDAYLDELAEYIAANYTEKFFLTIHHEPENDAGPVGMRPADYVAMQRRSIRMAERLAPRVTVVPVLQHWSFEPLNPRGDPSAWIVR